MRNQQQNGGYRFGPTLRKPLTKKKSRSRIMQKSCEQWKKSRECFRLSRPNRNNNANERGNDDGAKIARLHNGYSSKMVVNDHQDKVAAQKMRQIPLAEPSRVALQPDELKRPSSLNNTQRNAKTSRPSSSRPSNGMVSPHRNTQTQKNIEKSMPSSPKLKTEKSRHSWFRDGFSFGKLEKIDSIRLTDDSNSTLRVLKKYHHSPAIHNSSNIEQVVSGEVHKEDLWMAQEDSNSILDLKGKQIIQALRCNLGNNSSPKLEPLPEEKSETHENDDSEEAENCRPTKRRRRYIANEDEDDDGDQNLAGVDGGTAELTTRTALVKDRRTELSKPFVSDSVKLQYYNSLLIDEPIWSGILKIGSKKYVSLAAHVSTKYCENVWKLSRSLRPVVEVTKLSRLEAWPKSFEASRPTDDDIALYFLPNEMRPDEDLDHLVKEVMENDMVLRAVVGEAEMLIFASILLPEQHQTFQSKPYLWGVFKRREDNVAIVEEEEHGIGRCAQEEEMGKQHASCCGVGKDGCRVAGLNMDVGIEAPKEAERQGMEQELTPLLARPNLPHLAEGAARPTSAPKAAAMPANHGQIHSSLGVPSGAVFGFVVRQTQKT